MIILFHRNLSYNVVIQKNFNYHTFHTALFFCVIKIYSFFKYFWTPNLYNKFQNIIIFKIIIHFQIIILISFYTIHEYLYFIYDYFYLRSITKNNKKNFVISYKKTKTRILLFHTKNNNTNFV